MTTNKSALLACIRERLEAELAAIKAAALATHADATDDESKAEGKYDTRGLEASYLAHGQSKAAEEAAIAVAQFQALVPRDFAPGERVGLGALVGLEGAATTLYFIGPRAGGTEVEHGGRRVMVITPQSPLGRQLVGKVEGDSVQVELAGRRASFRVAAVT